MNKKSLVKKLIIILIPIYIIFGLGYLPSFIVYFTGLKYVFFTPEDYWKKIVNDNFDFYTKGFSKTYDLNYKYFTQYAINIKDENEKILEYSNGKLYKFRGKIKVEYFGNNSLIKTEYIHKWYTCSISQRNKSYLSGCELGYFSIPLFNKYKNLSIKLTVVEPLRFNSANKFKLYISPIQVYR